MLLDSDSDDDEQPRDPPSPLQDVMMDGDQFFDANRHEMFFSAGVPEDRRRERQELLDGIRNLDYYDHVVFGKMGAKHSDSAGEDLTVADAVVAMVDMGKNGWLLVKIHLK
jgi:hypothetical protein